MQALFWSAQMVDFGLRSNLKTIHQGQLPCIVRLNSGCGEHFTLHVLGAKPLKFGGFVAVHLKILPRCFKAQELEGLSTSEGKLVFVQLI